MKLPKFVMRYNPVLRKHTKHKIIQVKKRTASSLTRGSKLRARRRGVARGVGGLGRYSKKALSKWKRTGVKGTKKFDIRYECQESKKQFTRANGGLRHKRLQIQ